MKIKIFLLIIWLSFMGTKENFAQNRYKTLSIQKSRYQGNQFIQANAVYSPKTFGGGIGATAVVLDFLQVGGSFQFSKLRHFSYGESVVSINLEGNYDFFHVWGSNIIVSGLSRIALERTYVTSETEIVLDKKYPFKVIPQLGLNIDGYIMGDVILFGNFTQGYVVSSSYLDNWRYRINVGVKYLISK